MAMTNRAAGEDIITPAVVGPPEVTGGFRTDVADTVGGLDGDDDRTGWLVGDRGDDAVERCRGRSTPPCEPTRTSLNTS